ncbi:S8 family serine peptidase [Paenibacillus sp. MWE-103]|uniref:S8 family serine peptidase n=1 Tax=Paenibacillus artemisiicola TaxID=1172618 RepID=A0ABS3WGP4_9BACL|nr:S8 family serine peptidase [Paenibacillus artemisiicola]MBO7747496.1 S8 family serine peptidase [Paenibacillus artemisiicola]
MKRQVRKQALVAALSLSTAFGLTVPAFAADAGSAGEREPVAQTIANNARKSQWPSAPSESADVLAAGEQSPPLSLSPNGQDKFLASLAKRSDAEARPEASRIIVKYKPGAGGAAYRAESAAVADAWELPGTDLAVLETASADASGVLAELQNDPNVLYAEPDVKVHMASMPNDPLFPDQWGLRNVGQIIDGPIKGLPGFDINAVNAWEIGQGGGDVVVAVLDTGVDVAHPDLQANMWRNAGEVPGNGIDDDGDGFADDVNGWDFYNNDGTVYDAGQGDYHGTAVAGVIAAEANNGTGIAGVAPNAKILPLKVLGPDGTGYASDVIRAIQYADRAGARIANLSWTTDTYSKALEDAIAASPMLFAVAAGNEPKEDFSLKPPKNLDESPVYPASYGSPNIVTVGSVGPDGLFSYFSNYGPGTVDLAAPGIAVLSTAPSRNIGLGAQIDNSVFKAVYNVFGFEAMPVSEQRRAAFDGAMRFLSDDGGKKPSVLLVQDDMHDVGNPDALPVYADLLDKAGYAYDVETVPAGAAGPPLEKLSGYDAVIWFTGFGNESLNPADVGNVTSYLNGGGRLLLTGPGTLFRLADTPFMRDTLHLDFVRFEDSGNESWGFASGVAGTVYEGAQYSLTDQGIFSDVETNDPAVARVNLEIPVDDYDKSTGTSMSAPYAAGVAALLLGQDPSQDAEALKARLRLSGKPLASLQGKTANGKMLDAFGALTDDELPGKPLAGSGAGGTLDVAANPDDVYFVRLLAGDTLSLSLTGSGDADFDLYVYDPSAETIQSSSGMAAHSETEGSSSESIVYRAPATGYYYVDVHAFAGKGTYELRTSRDDAAVNGEGVYEDNDPAIAFDGAWTPASDAGYSGGTLKRANAEGSVSFPFGGGEITWIGMKGPDQGIADVYIDGVKVASPSLYNKWKQLRQTILKRSVPKGSHTLTIKWTGNQEAASAGSAINVDSLRVANPSEAYTVRLEENDVNFAFKGGWKKQSYVMYSNGHAMATYETGDEAVLTFTGTRGVLLANRLNGVYPKIAVTVDERPESEVVIDLNGDKDQKDTYQVPVFDTGELPNGKHTIRIINVTDFIAIGQLPIVVDALVVTKATKEEAADSTTTSIEDTNAAVKFAGLWQTNLSPRNSGKSAKYSNQTGSTVEAAFRGGHIIVMGTKGPDRGKADIYIDGKLATPNHVDLYSSSTRFQSRLFELTDLDDKPHTIKIVNTGEKNPSSSGNYLSFDALKVIGNQFEID